MKLHTNRFVISISLLIFCIVLPCGAEDLSQTYETIKKPAIASEPIKSATEFYVRPLNFSSSNPKDAGYNSQEEWENESKGLPKEFAEAFPVLLKKYANNNKKVIIISPNEVVKKGVIVEAVVTKIINLGSFFSGVKAELLCNLTFTDAESGQSLFSGVVTVSSYDTERPGIPMFGGYRSFSYHLHSSAFNVAFVLTKVMVNGNLQNPYTP
ncbi:MAG: hypothetical protein ACOYOS_13410 [Syntrophales bacterium]